MNLKPLLRRLYRRFISRSSDTRLAAKADRSAQVAAPAGLLSVRDHEPVFKGLHLVLAPTKTGTSALTTTLARLPLQGAVCRSHSIDKPHMRELVAQCRSLMEAEGRSLDKLKMFYGLEEQWRASSLVEVNRAYHAGIPEYHVRTNVLVTVREPIARYLSCLFYFSNGHLGDAGVNQLSQAQILRHMADPKEFPLPSGVCPWWDLEPWFNREVREYFGIDVFNTPFDWERGWQIYENDEARVLVMRQENFNKAAEALSHFYAIPADTIDLGNENTAEDQGYIERYRAARKTLHVPRAHLEVVYGTRYARHFYARSELDAFAARWQ